MASEDAKTVDQNKKGMLDLLFEQEKLKNVEAKVGFVGLEKDGENGGVCDKFGSSSTKDVIFGSVGVSVGSEVNDGLGEDSGKRGVCDNIGSLDIKDVIFGSIGVSVGSEVNDAFGEDSGRRVVCDNIGCLGTKDVISGSVGVSVGSEVNGEDYGKMGVCDTIDFLGIGGVIKGSFGDEKVDMGAEGEKEIRVGSENVEETRFNVVLCEDVGKEGVSDTKGLSWTEVANGGGKCIGAGEEGVLDKANGVENPAYDWVNCGILGKDSSIEGLSDSMDSLGTDSADKGNCGDDEGALDKELVVDSGIGVNCFSENNLEKVDMNGISLVVDISDDMHLAVFDKVEGEKVRNDNDGKNVYKAGDFVWGKFNSHPWWPAQIYDPSDASELARKRRPNDNSLLVAYFGDGTFLWRSPDQLKPFSENFDELSKGSDSIMFVTAVKDALLEIGRVAELKMCCNIISEEQKAGLDRKEMVNAGIKKGVIETQCDFERLPISDFKPLELLSKVTSLALGKNGIDMLEFTGIKSWFSAFYRAKTARKLECTYYEGLVIEGIGDVVWTGSSGGNEFGSVLKKCDNHKDSKKRKSVTKSIVKGGEENGVLSSENGLEAFEQENRELTTSRKRTKSKYLCFPFTDPNTSVRMIRPKRDLVLEPVKISEENPGVGKKLVSAAAKLKQSSPVVMKHIFTESEIDGSLKQKPSTEAPSAAIDPESFFESNSSIVVSDFINAYRKANESCSKSLRKKRENKPTDEITTLSEMKREGKRNKTVDGMGNNEALVFIKQKLESLTESVQTCDGEMFAEMKPKMETEMKGILEKVNGMLKST